SVISRDSQKAMAATLLLLLLFTFGGTLADSLLAEARHGAYLPIFSLTSPGYVFQSAGAWGKNAYWVGLLISHSFVWLLFGLACLLVPRTWQEKAKASAAADKSRSYAWKYGSARRRTAIRQKLLSRDP